MARDDDWDEEPGGRFEPRRDEIYSGGTIVRVPLDRAGFPAIRLGAPVHQFPRGGMGEPKVRLGGELEQIARDAVSQLGGERVRLPEGPNNPLTRPGCPIVALDHDPTDGRAHGGSKDLLPPFAVKQLLAMSMETPGWMMDWLYAEARRGVAPPGWLPGMLAGHTGAGPVLAYAAAIQAAMRS